MSLKYEAKKVGANYYVLPPVGDMKVEVHAFLSDDLYAASDEATWSQISNGASQEGVLATYLMPDCHSGFGVPIGSVVITDDTLIQGGSGYDISCGMSALRIPGLRAEHVQNEGIRRKWVQEVEKRVSLGLGSDRVSLQPSFSHDQVEEILRFGGKPLGLSVDACERQHLPVSNGFDSNKFQKAYSKALPQLGSLGGGNHFIELQISLNGDVWVVLHTGSRGYGWNIADHFFYAGAELRGLPSNQREASWLRMSEDLGREYWDYHNSAANYAIANRCVIMQGVQEALQEVFGCSGEIFYDISHNLIQEETVTLPNGLTRKAFVHRKGSTRAFPAGHIGLVGTRWYSEGHPIITPGSMFDGAVIMKPELGAYASACSVNHGAGRVLGRGAAKRQLKDCQDILDSEMSEIKRTFDGVTVEGIVSNHTHIPADESRHVYKSLDEVVKVLEEEKIAKLVHRLYPVANIKGA
jgi:tRNA-splicing ligase RtcB